MRHIKVLSVFGTRPDTIKLAPVVNELSKYPELIDSVTCGTAQHREMMDQVLGFFGITPDYDLGVMRDDQTLFDIAERGLRGYRKCWQRSAPISLWFMATRPPHLWARWHHSTAKSRLGMLRPGCGLIRNTIRFRKR